jgi:hypothetical protein
MSLWCIGLKERYQFSMVDEIDETGKRFKQMALSGNPTRWFERKGFDLFLLLKVSFLSFLLPPVSLISLRSNRS